MKTTIKTNKIPTQTHTKYVSGFTLIELLIVITIIGVLATIIVSSVSQARQKAHLTKTAAQLKAIERGLFAATLEEGRDMYWTMAELGGNPPPNGFRTIQQLLNIEHPNPGWAISNYLNAGHAQSFVSIQYRNLENIASECQVGAGGVMLYVSASSFSSKSDFTEPMNAIIDGEESNVNCGKYSPGAPASNWSFYRLSRNANVIEF